MTDKGKVFNGIFLGPCHVTVSLCGFSEQILLLKVVFELKLSQAADIVNLSVQGLYLVHSLSLVYALPVSRFTLVKALDVHERMIKPESPERPPD